MINENDQAHNVDIGLRAGTATYSALDRSGGLLLRFELGLRGISDALCVLELFSAMAKATVKGGNGKGEHAHRGRGRTEGDIRHWMLEVMAMG